jgi:hypothetical protein
VSTKQDQTISGEGSAVQAGRDVNITKQGLELAEVKELVEIFLERHLPALRDEAAAMARKNADAFMGEFVNRLGKPNQVTPEAFSKPDSQACFNVALNGSAEKGEQVETGLLAEAVLRRLESDENPLLKLVCEESVRALTKMGPQHIAFLAFVQYTKNVRHISFKELKQLEITAKNVLEVVRPGLALSEPNQEYLVSVGALTINRVANANQYFSSMQQSYPFFPENTANLSEEAPALATLVKAYENNGAAMVFLSSIGKMIGMLALEKALGKVDLTVWIH